MASVVALYSDSSSDSVKEIEPPKKLPPPLIDLDCDEVILNVKNNEPQLAKNFLKNCDIPMDLPESNPAHWTEDMRKFYNDDWGNEEEFTVQKLQDKMDKKSSLWQVSPKDLLFSRKRDKRYYLKCWNCCQFGHSMNQCREPLHPPKCHMCGETGHLEASCPNSICLNCGNQMNSYVLWCNKCEEELKKECSRCHLPGHHYLNCSDNWRRFHSTIGKSDVNIPNTELYKMPHEMWCCNCSMRGHNQIDCHAKKQLCFPETLPFVASYESSFKEQNQEAVISGKNHCNKFLTKVRIRDEYQINNQNDHSKVWKKLHRLNFPLNNGDADLRVGRNLNRKYYKKGNKKKWKKKKEKKKFIPGYKMQATPDFIPL